MGDLRKGFDMEVGKRLRALRKARRLTQEKLAEQLGTNAQYISQLERGERGLGHDMLSRYCHFFNLTPEKIGVVDEGREDYSPAVRMLLDLVQDWSEADILRLAADVTEKKQPGRLIELLRQKESE